jgi:hypothetical protein
MIKKKKVKKFEKATDVFDEEVVGEELGLVGEEEDEEVTASEEKAVVVPKKKMKPVEKKAEKKAAPVPSKALKKAAEEKNESKKKKASENSIIKRLPITRATAIATAVKEVAKGKEVHKRTVVEKAMELSGTDANYNELANQFPKVIDTLKVFGIVEVVDGVIRKSA